MTSIDMLHTIEKILPPGHPWGQKIIHLQTVSSTNTYAKHLAAEGAASGTLVIADHQSGGRGRMGRSFSSPAGLGLYLSLILRPHCLPKEIMHLTCAVGAAVATAVEQVAGISCGIKWTNDLVVGKRKLGGILTELVIDPTTQQVDYAIIGVGINCGQQIDDFPKEIQGIATSLTILGAKTDRNALAASVIVQLENMSGRLLTQKAQIMADFTARCVTIGQDISLVRGDLVRHGKALSIDENGALVVRFPDGNWEAVASGEVSIRGMYGYL